MGDGLKLSKDKRHRSSSSIAGAGLDGTRSERKLDIRALIPEVDDHFAIAESRCDDLQEKIELVKLLKRKKKLNKRSMTRVNEAPAVSDNVPFISVRTQPKKKVSQQGARTRRLDVAVNPSRGYVDPATLEQHRMLGQVWGYGRNYNRQNEFQPEHKPYSRTRPRRNRADGDGTCGPAFDNASAHTEVACGQEDRSLYSDVEVYDQLPGDLFPVSQDPNLYATKKRKNITKINEAIVDKNIVKTESLRYQPPWKNQNAGSQMIRRRQKQTASQQQLQQQQNQQESNTPKLKTEERPVVELFNKNRSKIPSPQANRSLRSSPRKEDKRTAKQIKDEVQNELRNVAASDSVQSVKKTALVRRKVRNRNYELPTVASQLKQADARYHCSVANCANIPFVVSKSTAPSHNIGVNIQQVLNGVKMQQPVNGIPMTIAHHMGLGHVSTFKKPNKPVKPSLNKGVINVISVGRKLLTLPSYRSISYNRLLSMYREGDGMVSRFLRAISRPNYIYTSMYDLTNREDMDGSSTYKGRHCERVAPATADEDTKRRLAEYADVYAEYEKLDALRKQGGHGSADIEQKCEELLRELLAREEIIKKRKQGGLGSADIEQKCEELLRELLAREEIIKKLMDNAMPHALNVNEFRSSTAALTEARRGNRD